MANVQSAEVNREQSMTQSLAQLQAEWRAYAEPIKTNDFLRLGYLACADALQPHIKREAAAQAKSLADERRIQELEKALQNLIMFTADGIATNEDGSPRSEWDFNAVAELRSATAALRVETK